VYPLYNISEESNPIEFRINSSLSSFIDLRNSTLYVQLKVVKGKEGTKLGSTDKVSTVNLLLHSLFEHVEILVGGTMLFDSNHQYSLCSFIQAHLGSSRERKLGELSCHGYYVDNMGGVNLEGDAGQKARMEAIADSKVVELEGNLFADVANSNRYFPNQTNIVIRLKRASPDWILLKEKGKDAGGVPVADTPGQYRIELVKCKLKVMRHFLHAPVSAHIQNMLNSGKIARCNYKKCEVKLTHVATDLYTRFVQVYIYMYSISLK